MIIFLLIILIEVLLYLKRGFKRSVTRVACNAGSALIAGLAALIWCKNTDFDPAARIPADFSFSGLLGWQLTDKLTGIINDFSLGIIACVLFIIIFWVIKIISFVVTKIVLKEEKAEKISSVPIVCGLVAGIICAGITVMPFTGILQCFPDKDSKEATNALLNDVMDPEPGIVRLIVKSPASTVSHVTGIGFITDAFFNSTTTAVTDSGSENLKTFLSPLLKKADRIGQIISKTSPVSEKAKAAGDVLTAASETTLLTDPEILTIIDNAVQRSVPGFEAVSQYETLNELSDDVRLLGNVLAVFEKYDISLGGDISGAFKKFLSANITDADISGISDNIYAMHGAEYFLRFLLAKAFGLENLKWPEGMTFQDTKKGFSTLLSAAARLVSAFENGNPDAKTLLNEINAIRESKFLDENSLTLLLSALRNGL